MQIAFKRQYSGYDAALTATGTNDHSYLQTVMDELEANGGGSIFLKAGAWDFTSGGITPRNGVTLTGVKPVLDFTQNCPDLGFPIIGGTYFQGASGVDAVSANTSADPVSDDPISCGFYNLGFSDFRKVFYVGGQNHLGFAFTDLHDIFIDTTTSDAFELTNFQHINARNIKMYNVARAGLFQGWHENCQPGNSYFADLYAYIAYATNPDYGLKLAVNSTNLAAGNGSLNMCTFVRPQINMFGGSAAANSGNSIVLLQGDAANSRRVLGFGLIDLDIEGSATYGLRIKDATQGNVNFTQIPSASEVTTTIKLETAQYTNIFVNSNQCELDMDSGSDPCFLFGALKNANNGSSGRVPRGMYYASDAGDYMTVQGGSQLVKGMQIGNANAVRPTGAVHTADPTTMLPIAEILFQGSWANGSVSLGSDRTGGLHVINNSGSVTKTLPAASILEGFNVKFKKISATGNDIVIDTADTATIDGAASITLTTQYEVVELVCDGTNWHIV